MPERNCLLCGEMTCACSECRGHASLRAIFGLCQTCTEELAKRAGEVSAPATNGDESIKAEVRSASEDVVMRCYAKLAELKKEASAR